MTIYDRMTKELEARKDRSAWNKGVTVYALELVEQLAEADKSGYLDAADLTAPRMLQRTRNGERRPNSREEWLDTQARALYQAANRVCKTLRAVMAG